MQLSLHAELLERIPYTRSCTISQPPEQAQGTAVSHPGLSQGERFKQVFSTVALAICPVV